LISERQHPQAIWRDYLELTKPKVVVLMLITSLVGIVLVIVFFVTSSDSGSLVIDTITAGGKVDAPVPQRAFWCIFEGAVAIVLLLSAGGLQ
ncbi:BCCT family transporter, partial [Burkholderia sp. SIMBA_052]|uniref:BCCT family transporter n=1 Tax=Burkholderia sp. SIMBA_052 TaxID=3085793 RepID=UPI00397E6F41